VDPRKPIPAPPAPRPAIQKPKTLEELARFTESVAAGVDVPLRDAPLVEAPSVDAPEAAAASAEAELVRHVARDCLDTIASHRNLRKPNAIETWVDQEPFEQRILENVDAFASLGGAALPLVSLYQAEADAPDPERAFAIALTLGCIDGSDTTGAAVTALKQSAPEDRPGFREGLWLAPSPAIDAAMIDLTTSARPDLVVFALDVLHARGTTPPEILPPLLGRAPAVARPALARALATALSEVEALPWLRSATQTSDDELFFAASLALVQRRDPGARALLRDAVDAGGARGARAVPLLALVGSSVDLARLVDATKSRPTAASLRALGRFGHVGALPVLSSLLTHDEPEIVAAAAEALERITGAGLREIVEEPWEVALPPEVSLDAAIPVPLRRVERVVTDPKRWRAWLDANLGRLDPKVKTRAGVAFHALQIVDELGALVTPPEARVTAALELRLVTGIATTFSPDDWVARQRTHLEEIRAAVRALPADAGRWPLDARRAASPAAAPEAAAAVVRPPAELTETTGLPEGLLASLGLNLPFPAKATPAAAEDAAAAPTPLAPGAPPPPRGRALSGTSFALVAPTGPALPFEQQGGARANTDDPASPTKASPPVHRAPAALSGTAFAFVAPKGPALPFAGKPADAPATPSPAPLAPPQPPTPPAVQRAPAALSRTSLAFVAPKGVATPFDGKPSPGAPPAPPPPRPPAPPAPSIAPPVAPQPPVQRAPAALSGTSFAAAPKGPALPFQGGPGARTPAASQTPAPPPVAPAPKRPPAALAGTSLSFVVPKGPALPFAGAPPAPPPPEPPAPPVTERQDEKPPKKGDDP
jgi:hypothetical protein